MRAACLALVLVLMMSQAVHSQDAPMRVVPRVFRVDALHGDDQRDGLTPQTAWRSLARVNSFELKPGDTVRFRRGQVWRGQLRPQSGDASGVIR